MRVSLDRMTWLARGLVFTALLHVTLDGHSEGQRPGPAPGETLSQSFRGSQRDNVEYQKVSPITVFDNLHYVGAGSVGAWLVPTSDGLFLIDTTQEPLVDHVIDSIRKVGFDPRNIRYILLTHGHLDHFGGVGKIRALSGARVGALESDWRLIDAFYENPGQARGNRDPGIAFTRDLVLEEGQTLTLGTTSLRVYHLPGHTAGSPAFEFTVYDKGTPHRALLWGGTAPRNGVEGGTQFLDSIRRIRRQFGDIDVPIVMHSWLNAFPYPGGGAIFEPAMKLARRGPGEPHPFVDNAAWRQWLDIAEAGTIKYIDDERSKATR